MKIPFLLLFVFSFQLLGFGQYYSESSKFLDIVYQTNTKDNFGSSLCVKDSIALVGAPGFESKGAVFVYNWTVNGWNYIATLRTSDSVINGKFGFSVDMDGDCIVVGAPNHNGKGAAYVFQKPSGGWQDATETAILLPSNPTDKGAFGFSVSILNNEIAITHYGYWNASTYHIYEKPVTGWENATEDALLKSSGNLHNGDGRLKLQTDYLVVGAWSDGSNLVGKIHIFNKPVTGWVDTTQQSASLSASDVASREYFARTIDVLDNCIIAGTEDHNGVGAAYIFEKPAEGWKDTTETAKLMAKDSVSGDKFGAFVRLHNNTAYVSATEKGNVGSVYRFQKPVTGWKDTVEYALEIVLDTNSVRNFGNYIELFNNELFVGADKTTVNSNIEQGVAYQLFELVDGNTITNTLSSPGSYPGNTGDNLGKSVAVYQNTAVVGIPEYQNYGCALVLEKTGNSWQTIARLTASNGKFGDKFGESVDIYNNIIVVGAPENDDSCYNCGTVYVFEKPITGWENMNQTAKLTSSNIGLYSSFGSVVSVEGNTIAISDPIIDVSTQRGAEVYVYERPLSGWKDTIETAILREEQYGTENLGISLKIKENTIIIGAESDVHSLFYKSGAVFFYEKPNGGWVSTNTPTSYLDLSETGLTDYYEFGKTLDIYGDYLITAGLSNAHLFEKQGNNWSGTSYISKFRIDSALSGYYYINKVAISDENIAISAGNVTPNHNWLSGAVALFTKTDTGWVNTEAKTPKLVSSDRKYDNLFGESMAFANNQLLVGDSYNATNGLGAGALFIYNIPLEDKYLPTEIVNSSKDVILYPNPTNGIVYFKEPENTRFLAIYDNIGRKILDHTNGLNNSAIDLSGLMPGIYFITLKTSGKTITTKIIKQ